MEVEEEDMSPFWLQTTNRQRRLRRTSSLVLNSGFLLMFALCIVLVVVFIVIPTFLSFTSQIFKPHLVKRSWDYLNLVLVLFAVVCGFFRGAGNSNDDNNNNNNSDFVTPSYDEDHKFVNTSQYDQKSSSTPSTPHHWYDYQTDQMAYKTLQRLRSSSSYPDLRLESPWLITDDDRWRFYDDTRVNNNRSLTSDQLYHRRPRRDKEEEQQQHQYQLVESVGSNNKSSLVKEEDLSQAPAPPSPSPPRSPSPRSLSPPPLAPPSPPPLPPQPTVVKRKVKRTYNDVPAKERPTENKHLNVKTNQLPPPPPPPPPPVYHSKIEKKRGGASATKDLILASLRRKKKKQRQKSVEDLNFLFKPEEPTSNFPSYQPKSPPPPPPPPPTDFFQNLFSSKKGKTKARVHSFSSPSPPPPRPLEARASKTNAQKAPITAQKPPPPAKTTAYNTYTNYTGNESPLNIPIPQPPPPPPFKMAGWKFVVQGDYVRIKSNDNSPRSESSAELDGGDENDQASTPSGGDSPVMTSSKSPLFCPSPDVNTKADNFIAKVRADLRLEKMNSVRARSNLGLGLSGGPVSE